MFDRDALSEAERGWRHDPRPLRWFDHGQQDFVPAASEQRLHVHRGWRRDFEAPVAFWLASLDRLSRSLDEALLEGEWRRRLEACVCRPSTAEDYARLWGFCHGLQGPSGLEGLGEIARYQRMFDRWDDQAFLVETADEYAAVYWSTSA